jgi:7-cyano-7-deazaguanine reductase
MKKAAGPAYLGKQTNEPTKKLDRIEVKAPPFPGEVYLLCTEFTSFCPVTHQPDFGELLITYRPGRWLVETKSLKLFLWSFRERGDFNESIVREIAEIFFLQVAPVFVSVRGTFHSRGGIGLTCLVTLPDTGGEGE